MDLDSLRAFVRVAELASFTQAADQLGLARSRVSEAVTRLETELGARLLQRTTRSVRLTDDGERLLVRAQALLHDAAGLQRLFQPPAAGLRGRLRLDAPHTLARDVLIPRLPAFLAPHPQLDIALSSTDRHVDLVTEGFDVVLRVGHLADTSLVARPLGVMPLHNLASPAYLRRHGVPRTLADLDHHRVVHYASSLNPAGACWDYLDAQGQARHRPMACSLVVNSTDAYEAACVAGLGLIQVPVLGSQTLVDQGALHTVMPDCVAPPLPVSLLYAHRRQLPLRVRALIDWLDGIITPMLSPLPAPSP
jgi:DNA-binding transcriptional LysR family regulator